MDKPTVVNIDDAKKWIDVLHRRTVQDAEHMRIIEARLSVLETPRWRWRKRQSHRAWLSFLYRELKGDS